MSFISQDIINYFTELYGDKLTKAYQDIINQKPAQFVRVNHAKISTENLISSLKSKYDISCNTIANYNNILNVKDEKNLLGKTLEHILGYYYIQSLSSFIPPLVLNPNKNDLVLDLCSAPGSKTTELGEIMKNQGTITANEIQIDRIKGLVFNIERMNQMNVGVVHSKGEQLNTIYDNYFDKILIDAPCSGLGIIQKKNEISEWWNLERVRRLSELQLKLLVSALKMLKVGGELVYSTCTLTVEENELIIDKIINKYPVEVQDFTVHLPTREGITSYKNLKLHPSLKKAKRILPWEVNSDGFFIIKLIKTGMTKSSFKKVLPARKIHLIDSSEKTMRDYLLDVQNEFGIDNEVLTSFKFIIKGNNIFFVDRNWNDPNPSLFVRIGNRFGTINKAGKIVLHSHAAQVLSDHIKKNIYELKNQDELKTYLEGGVVKNTMNSDGQCVVKFNNYTLGTAVFTEAGLKSQFPRAFRTSEIVLPNE